MTTVQTKKSLLRYILMGVVLVFGVATIKSGGDVLFWNSAARQNAGQFVAFVVWANFILGFFYVACAFVIALKPQFAVKFAAAILIATLAVFAALGIHIFIGGAYEARTIAAMALRTVVWGVAVIINGRLL